MHPIEGLSLRLFNSNHDQGVSQMFVDAVMILGQKMRADRKPGEYYKFKHVPQIRFLHIAKGLTANLGRMAFSVERSVAMQGLDLVAPSTKGAAESLVQAQARGNGTRVLCPTDDNKRIQVVEDGKIQHTFVPYFASIEKRTHDSEFLLMNYLDRQLQLQRPLEAGSRRSELGGELVLMSDRIPCKHCLRVIRQFAEKYPRFICNVVYFYETADRHPASVVKPDFPPNLHLFQAALSVRGADVTRVGAGTPHYALSPRVLDQAESMDSSAHVSGRAMATLSIYPRRSLSFAMTWRKWYAVYSFN